MQAADPVAVMEGKFFAMPSGDVLLLRKVAEQGPVLMQSRNLYWGLSPALIPVRWRFWLLSIESKSSHSWHF